MPELRASTLLNADMDHALLLCDPGDEDRWLLSSAFVEFPAVPGPQA